MKVLGMKKKSTSKKEHDIKNKKRQQKTIQKYP